MDLKDIKIEDIKTKISSIDRKTLIKFGIGFTSIIIFLIIYYLILNPIVKAKKSQLEDMTNKQTEIAQFEQEIISNKAKIKKLTPEFERHSSLFHTKVEVEGLYQSLSEHAGLNGLIISKIEKKKKIAVMKPAPASTKKKKKKDEPPKKIIAYYKIPVKYEIRGNFLGYIKFKRALSRSKKMLNFDKESIKVVKADSTSTIIATGELTILGLTNEFN